MLTLLLNGLEERIARALAIMLVAIFAADALLALVEFSTGCGSSTSRSRRGSPPTRPASTLSSIGAPISRATGAPPRFSAIRSKTPC
jgi:hypothetical protein